MRPILITGGAGFIGTNLAHRLLRLGRPVIIYDNLSRAGVERNLCWLKSTHGDRVTALVADTRDRRALGEAVQGVAAVFHFAAQVAVTTSLLDPLADFAVNAGGTLNLLQALTMLPEPPPLVFTSTNKVYGRLEDVSMRVESQRYVPKDAVVRASGIGEDRPLDFHSPYGCSKGAADQYVLDYARSFRLKTLVYRMSCIYGPHQLGNEDQGWVAHFLIRALNGDPLTIYGDGLQVRDVLYVEDLLDAFLLGLEQIDRLSGQAFNVGGGPAHTVSLLELLELLTELHGRRPRVTFEPWRTGDQRYYVSDTRRLEAELGWRPRVGVRDGLQRLSAWLQQDRAGGGEPALEEVLP